MHGELTDDVVSAASFDDRLAVSPAEAARLLGIGKTFLYELLNTGKLPGVKIGARRLITMESIRRFLSELEPRR